LAANILKFFSELAVYFTTGDIFRIFGKYIIKLLSMNSEESRTYCLSKKGVEEAFPFDNETLVFKVGGKIFLLMSISSKPLQFNVKCNPDRAVELREKHSFVLPGYHMNKQHWNTIVCDRPVPKKLLFEWIDHSYGLVILSLPKKAQQALKD
jgi:predicted DNA-binding protein (MmcQ/YjbR family)